MLKRMPNETRKAHALRLLYLIALLGGAALVAAYLPIKPMDWNPYRLGLAIGLATLGAGWAFWSRTPSGQRTLASPRIEGPTLAWATLVLMALTVQLFMTTEFSRRHVLGAWPSYRVVSALNIAGQLNSMGFRDIEHTLEKPPGVVRIVLLGDSFTAGQGVTLDEYYPQRLRELAPANVEVIVVAEPGDSTRDQIERFREVGRLYAPDVVIVGAVTNDLDQAKQYRAGIGQNRESEDGVPAAQRQWRVAAALLPIDLSFMLDYYINMAGGTLKLRQDYREFETSLYQAASEEGPSSVELWREAVGELYDEVSASGAAAYAFVLPSPRRYSDPSVYEMTLAQHQTLSEGFAGAGFHTVDLLPDYLERFGDVPYRRLWALPNDGHPGAEIHAFYAERMWAEIEDTVREIAE
jgi:lysophospholipase L1-like esterase